MWVPKTQKFADFFLFLKARIWRILAKAFERTGSSGSGRNPTHRRQRGQSGAGGVPRLRRHRVVQLLQLRLPLVLLGLVGAERAQVGRHAAVPLAIGKVLINVLV